MLRNDNQTPLYAGNTYPMEQDLMRNKLGLKLYCSKHPESELRFSTDLSKIGASSAYEINVKIVVHPCDECRKEMERIESAIGVLMSINKQP